MKWRSCVECGGLCEVRRLHAVRKLVGVRKLAGVLSFG